MTGPLKVLSASVTAVLLIAAVAVGGGALPRPDRLASLASEAARNTRVAAENIGRAADDTEALAVIADNVRTQLKISERLLDTQLRIERSSRAGASRSQVLTEEIDRIGKVLDRLETRLERTSALSEGATSIAETSAASADELQRTLDRLQASFDVLVGESRELNRKAHGYRELRDGPG